MCRFITTALIYSIYILIESKTSLLDKSSITRSTCARVLADDWNIWISVIFISSFRWKFSLRTIKYRTISDTSVHNLQGYYIWTLWLWIFHANLHIADQCRKRRPKRKRNNKLTNFVIAKPISDRQTEPWEMTHDYATLIGRSEIYVCSDLTSVSCEFICEKMILAASFPLYKTDTNIQLP